MGERLWIDQTFATLPDGISRPALAAAVLSAAKLGLGRQDISVKAWSEGAFAAALPSSARGVVALEPCEIHLAFALGFTALRLDCCWGAGEAVWGQARAAAETALALGLETTLLVSDASALSGRQREALYAFCRCHPSVKLAVGDRDGLLFPLRVPAFVAEMATLSPGGVSFFFDNCYDVATANAWAAYGAGVRSLAVSVGGGAFPAWEELLLLLHRQGVPDVLPDKLAGRCRTLLAGLGRPVRKQKAVIGCRIFAHESGLHVDGIAKEPAIYEAFSPELVGAARKIVVGKHSGRAAVRVKLSALGLHDAPVSEPLMAAIRSAAVTKCRALTDEELQGLIKEVGA